MLWWSLASRDKAAWRLCAYAKPLKLQYSSQLLTFWRIWNMLVVGYLLRYRPAKNYQYRPWFGKFIAKTIGVVFLLRWYIQEAYRHKKIANLCHKPWRYVVLSCVVKLNSCKLGLHQSTMSKPTRSQVCRYTTLWNVKCMLQRFTDRAIDQCRRRLECVVQQQLADTLTFDTKTAGCDSYFRQ